MATIDGKIRTRTEDAPGRPYHHGNLRAALVAATVQLLEEQAPETVTVRAAARRAGVSSGAPFRHFPDRTALMTAVAEEAHRRLRAEMDLALALPAGDPPVRYRAVGSAYLRWALANPTLFHVVSTRRLIDYDGSRYLREDNAKLRAEIAALLEEAQRRGDVRPMSLAHLELAARALVYGLARMSVDGQLAQWGIPGETAEAAMDGVLDLFVAGLRPAPP
jgi:AcrR family transcriptional regulator